MFRETVELFFAGLGTRQPLVSALVDLDVIGLWWGDLSALGYCRNFESDFVLCESASCSGHGRCESGLAEWEDPSMSRSPGIKPRSLLVEFQNSSIQILTSLENF